MVSSSLAFRCLLVIPFLEGDELLQGEIASPEVVFYLEP